MTGNGSGLAKVGTLTMAEDGTVTIIFTELCFKLQNCVFVLNLIKWIKYFSNMEYLDILLPQEEINMLR